MRTLHRNARAALLAALALAPRAAGAELSIAEVFYDATSGDDHLEWVELANDGDVAIDLAAYSLGWGGTSWLAGRQALEGTIDAGDRFVVGGPLSTPANASPAFDLAVDLDSDLQNGGATADGVALFDVPADALTAETLPIAVVLYGTSNASGLLDPTGAIAAVDVLDSAAGESIERGTDGVWRAQPLPTPGAPPTPVPEPPRVAVALAGAGAFSACAIPGRRRRAARSRA
jgi:hypothetical protein